MRLSAGLKSAVLAMVALVLTGSGRSQDTRTVTEPVFPTACTVLEAQQEIAAGEPSSETLPDTTRLQNALAACASGQAVELTTNGTNNAFLIGPITLPAGVTLLVDGGVTVFGSRNPADYQSTTAGVETCGTVGTAGNGCLALITANAANSAIMGYGVIDGRGQDDLLVNGVATTYSWWDNSGTAQLKSGAQNNPLLVSADAANLVLYKITLRNSPMFHVKWTGNLTTKTGFTAWGVKVITPFTARNSDGIDPSGKNISILNSSISDGDDDVAVSASNAAQDITVSNVNTYSGHGISIGSGTKGGLTNMLVQNIVQTGTATDSNAIGIRIKAQQSNGGLVQNVTYQNICSANNKVAIYLSPYYSTSAGTSYPSFQNIVYRNIHVITEGRVTLQGYQNSAGTVINPSTITLDNVVFDALAQKDLTPAPQDLAVTLGPGPVSPLLTTLTGTNITYTGSVTMPNETPYPCSQSTLQYLVGELYASTATETNLQTESLTAPASVTLNAMLQPAMSQVSYASISRQGTYTGAAAPTATVQFMEGTTVVGTGTLSGNGTIATGTLTGVTAGTHTYTAQYPGDGNYGPYSFGSVTVTVWSSTLVTTATSLTASPSSGTYGASTMLTATVTGAGGTPTGQVQFMEGVAPLGSSTLNAAGLATLTQVLGGGSNSITAVYNGDTTFAASTSAPAAVVVNTAASATALTAAPATLPLGTSAVLTAVVTGVQGGAVPTGSVTFYDAATNVGSGTLDGTGKATVTVAPSTPGAHSITAVYMGDANYATSQTPPVTVTVTPGGTTTTLSPTTTTLSLSTPTIFTGGPATLTATVASSSGTPTGTVTFLNGTASLGTASLTSGTATMAAPTNATGTLSITAVYAANGTFAGSTSGAATLTVVAPIGTPQANPGSLSLAAGTSGKTAVTVMPAGGFTGTVTFSCTSPVAYVTCTMGSTSITAGVVQSTATISVAATGSEVRPGYRSGSALYAVMLPLGLFGLAGLARRRRVLGGMLMLVLLMVAGCGGG